MLSKELEIIKSEINEMTYKTPKTGADYHYFFYVAILFSALFQFKQSDSIFSIDTKSIKEHAIKVIDPLEIINETDTYKDFVTF